MPVQGESPTPSAPSALPDLPFEDDGADVEEDGEQGGGGYPLISVWPCVKVLALSLPSPPEMHMVRSSSHFPLHALGARVQGLSAMRSQVRDPMQPRRGWRIITTA